jgi:hypothetical protein
MKKKSSINSMYTIFTTTIQTQISHDNNPMQNQDFHVVYS